MTLFIPLNLWLKWKHPANMLLPQVDYFPLSLNGKMKMEINQHLLPPQLVDTFCRLNLPWFENAASHIWFLWSGFNRQCLIYVRPVILDLFFHWRSYYVLKYSMNLSIILVFKVFLFGKKPIYNTWNTHGVNWYTWCDLCKHVFSKGYAHIQVDFMNTAWIHPLWSTDWLC